MANIKKEILYLHVTPRTKKWLKSLCKKQVFHATQSVMAELLFKEAQKLKLFDRRRVSGNPVG